jgi:hypothetical protein
MTKILHHQIQERIRVRLRECGVKEHLFYAPTSDRYWNEPFRLVAVNMEPYGLADKNISSIDRDELMTWIYDGGATRTRTTRYTLALLSGILAIIHNNVAADADLFRSAYQNDSLIEETLDRIAYYNMRPQSNSQKAQDSSAIAAVGRSEFGRLLWEEILALDPHVILVSGQAGRAAINQVLNLTHPILFRGSAIHNGVLIQSIPHPSRPSYADWSTTARKIRQWKESGSM